MCLVWCLFFFFFKQKTAYEMRISDWSSDVCSSDLRLRPALGCAIALVSGRRLEDVDQLFAPLKLAAAGLHGLQRRDAEGHLHEAGTSSGSTQIGRASCRERVCQYV